MKLDVILAESNSGIISIAERSHIRRIIGVPEVVTEETHQKSEDRFNLISKRQSDGITAAEEEKNIFLCKEIRTIYKLYDKLGDDTTFIKGASDGVDTSAQRNRTRVAIFLYNRVFPPTQIVPNEDIFSAMAELKDVLGGDSGNIMHIPVSFNDYLSSDNDY